MLFTNTTFIGIDPTAGIRPFIYAALDYELRLLALSHGSIDDVLAFAAGQKHATVGICAPRSINLGRMEQTAIRESLSPPPHPGRWVNCRVAEYLLRQHNISIPLTPASEADCSNWMRMGFSLYRRLEGFGYQRYPHTESERQCLEIYPHACYTVLLEVIPYPKHTLEGRLQRQLLLHELGLSVPDPMRLFEEITRYRLLKGKLPLEGLYEAGELDAIVAAYCSWLANHHPERITALGDPEEGQTILPSAELKAYYS